MKLSEFTESKFWPYCKRLRRNTVTGYRSAYNTHIQPHFGEWELEDITVEAIELWLAEFEKTGAAKKAYSVLRNILRKAYKWQRMSFDPTVLDVELPHHPTYHPVVLQDKDIHTTLKAFYEHEIEPVVICSLTLGLRRGESCGLTWGDIDLRSGQVQITKSRQYIERQVVIMPPKTDLSERTLFLPKFALKRLRELGKGRAKNEWICPLSPDAIGRKYKAHCKKMGIPYVPMKNLRHSYATSMLRAGIDIVVLSQMLGHADVSTTERYYLVPDEKLYKASQSVWEHKIMKQAKEVDVTTFRLVQGAA